MKNNKEIAKRKPLLIEAFSIIALLVGLLVYAVMNETSIVSVLVITASYIVFIGTRCGYTWKEMLDAMSERCKSLIEVLLIFYAIGIFIGAMMYSGTIPTIIYYLITIINPSFMIVLSFIITSAVSMIIGTSWGTAGTVGIIMVSIAASMGVSLPMVAGAVISGSHVGQLLSPMSSMTNLSANFAKTDATTMIKRMSYYAVPVVTISLVAYTVLGFTGATENVSLESISSIRTEISSVFNVNPIVILPMLLVFIMTLKKQPVVKALITSSLVAIVFGAIFNGFSPAYGIEVMYSGFSLSNIPNVDVSAYSEVFNNLVNRGGMTSMNYSVLLALIATCLGAIMSKVEIVTVIVESVFAKVKSRPGLTISATAVAALMDACTSSSFLAILLASEFFRDKFYQAGMDDKDLIAAAASVGSQFIAAVPWADTAVYMVGITGVATMASLPYSFFCWGNALMIIILSFFGIGFAKNSNIQEKQAVVTD